MKEACQLHHRHSRVQPACAPITQWLHDDELANAGPLVRGGSTYDCGGKNSCVAGRATESKTRNFNCTAPHAFVERAILRKQRSIMASGDTAPVHSQLPMFSNAYGSVYPGLLCFTEQLPLALVQRVLQAVADPVP